MKNKPAANEGFIIAEGLSFANTFMQDGSSVLAMQFIAKTTHHRPPPKRWVQQKTLSA